MEVNRSGKSTPCHQATATKPETLEDAASSVSRASVRPTLPFGYSRSCPRLAPHALHFLFELRSQSSLSSFATINNDDNIPSGPPFNFLKETDHLTY